MIFILCQNGFRLIAIFRNCQFGVQKTHTHFALSLTISEKKLFDLQKGHGHRVQLHNDSMTKVKIYKRLRHIFKQYNYRNEPLHGKY